MKTNMLIRKSVARIKPSEIRESSDFDESGLTPNRAEAQCPGGILIGFAWEQGFGR